MAAADKLKLRKDLEKYHGAVKQWKRDDLVLGRWFPQFLDRTLGSIASATSPAEIRAKHKDSTEADDLADDVVSSAIHDAIAATDAYQENLSGTEIRNLKEKKPGGEQKLTGDVVALVAELLYANRLNVDLMFSLAAVYERMLTADKVEIFEEAFGRALGAFDYDKAKKDGNPLEQIGAKIYERAVIQTVGSPLVEAQRKGFYCLYAKAIAKETQKLLASLPKWTTPKEEPGTGAVLKGPPDEEPPAYET